MDVFCITDPDANDEVTQYQTGRYFSTDGGRIFSFSKHERHPTIVHLAVHLDNEYISRQKTQCRVLNDHHGTKMLTTSSFATCESDPFAITLLCSEILDARLKKEIVKNIAFWLINFALRRALPPVRILFSAANS